MYELEAIVFCILANYHILITISNFKPRFMLDNEGLFTKIFGILLPMIFLCIEAVSYSNINFLLIFLILVSAYHMNYISKIDNVNIRDCVILESSHIFMIINGAITLSSIVHLI